MIPTFIRSFTAAAAVEGYTIAKFADPANAKTVTEADGNTAALLGVFDKLGGASGDMVDVHLAGLVEVKLGGTVAAGDPVTSNASGHGIEAAAAAGTTVRIIGFAAEPGVSGDIIDVWLSPGIIHEA